MRVSKTAAGLTTYYLYDEASGNPFPLLEAQQSGSTTNIVGAYGFAADGLRSRFSRGGSFYTSCQFEKYYPFAFDNKDLTGSTTDYYTYDPPGNYRSASGRSLRQAKVPAINSPN